VVLSPHLDDGVLSCGDALAARPGAVVVTVFAGCPPDDTPSTEWDRASGFGSAREAIDARRAEDREALRRLRARPRWLEWCDAQYGTTRDADAIARSLRATLADYIEQGEQTEHDEHDEQLGIDVLAPLGLFHADHVLVSDAALLLIADTDSSGLATWVLYADALYRTLDDLLDRRLAVVSRRLRAHGLVLSPLAPPPPSDAKEHAVSAYASQLRALATPGRPGHHDAFTDECYWAIAR
jgi:LmbE family N-acetylglucosaminyl deacetylase